MDFRRFLITLRLQFWPLVALSLASLGLFLLLPKVGTKTEYISMAKILLTPSHTPMGSDSYQGSDPSNWLADENTLQELVTSERLLERVRQICSVREEWQDLRDRIQVEPLSEGRGHRVDLFSLYVRDESPKQSQKIAETVVQEFTNYVEELSAREFANTRRFLEELVAESDDKINKTEEELLEITSNRADTTQAEAMITSLAELDVEKRKAREDVAMLAAELESVQSYLADSSSSMAPASLQRADSSLSMMESSLTTARLKLLELEQFFTSENVQVVEQRAKLQKMQQVYVQQMSDYAGRVSREKSRLLSERRKQLRSIEERISEIRNQQLTPTEKRRVAKLERQLAMWEDNTLNLTKQMYQARVVEQSSRRQGAITMLEKPGLGVFAKEKKARSLGARIALGTPFCIAFSIALILGWDILHASLRLTPKIEACLGVPVFAVIPQADPDIVELWEDYKKDKVAGDRRSHLLLEDDVPIASDA